jgi:adenylate cyclase
MTERGRRVRRLALAGVAVVSVAVGLLLYATDALKESERDTVDARFNVRGTEDPPDDIVVVEINDVTFSELGLQWPFPRSVHGKLLDQLSRDRPTAITFDIQFTERSREPREDLALAAAVDRADNVILSTTEVGPNGETNVLGGNAEALGARVGNTNLPPDPGGVLRRFEYSIDGLVTFPVATVEAITGEEVDESEFEGETLIDYQGPPETFDHVSYSTVVNGETEPGFFADKIVVIGATAPTLQDVHPTSTTGEDLMSGPEIQANAIETVREGLPLSLSGGGIDVPLIVLMGIATPLASLRFSPLRTLAGGVLLGLLYAVIAQLAFNGGLVLEVIYPLGTLALATVGMLAVQYLLTAFEREQVRSTFARFVPEGVVGDVLARTDEDLRLGGVRMECTVLFSDVRGFTTFSEGRPAEEVVDILNRYLGDMTDAILEHGGTVVSYMGDGIMAVFGAPIEQPDHADRALAAARAMLTKKLPAFNEWIRSKGIDEFRMGIGLNSGPVMAGNVGSDRRLEYTTIGDTVNTASRLEGMTKGTPHPLYVSDPTRELLRDQDTELAYVDELPVRGRKAKVKIWTVPELSSES